VRFVAVAEGDHTRTCSIKPTSPVGSDGRTSGQLNG
jgi:hypothetical protein